MAAKLCRDVDARQDAFDVSDAQPKVELTQEFLTQLGVEIPSIPGDVSLSGNLPSAVISAMLSTGRYKAWLFIDSTDSEFYFPEVFSEAAGVKMVASEWSKPVPASDAQADAVVEAIETLPRPLMVQCKTGARASAALAYWLAKRRGYSVESMKQLASDADLKCFTRCMVCGPMTEWLLERLSAPGDGPSVSLSDSPLIFAQLFDPVSSTFTYLVGSRNTKTCLLLDPVLEQKDRDLALVDELGLVLRYVVNTHCHADHITSGGAIRKERPDVKTVISRASGAKADVLVDDGDRIVIEEGVVALEVMATPGHTDGCTSFLLKCKPLGSKQEDMVFTGDTMLIRGCGRTDFQQGSSERLYQSVHSKLFTLDESTLVYPGHDYKGRTVSSIGEEKKYNPRLTKSEPEFTKLMSELNLPYPKKIDVALPANLQCGVQD